MSDTREDRVRQRAHEIWLREGQPEGQDERHWAAAEAEIDAEAAAKPKKAAKTPAPNAELKKVAASKAAAPKKPAKAK